MTGSTGFSFNLEKQIPNFAHFRLFIIEFGYDTNLGSSYLGKLFIRLNICNFLELNNFVTFGNI